MKILNHLSKVLVIVLLFLACSCTNRADDKFSFYHWKSNAELSELSANALKTAKTHTVYLRYFDVKNEKNYWGGYEPFPTYVIGTVGEEFKNFDIIPVVYIKNEVFSVEENDVRSMATKVKTLIHQISERHFDKQFKKVQIDCDWTVNTKSQYFEFLKILSEEFEVDATIRLHQIKFKKETGIPPIKSGTLMLYNVGDLKNKNQNSILESSIVEQYINTNSSYPIPLNIALPIFSQTVVSNADGKVKIIKDVDRSVYENDLHFKKIDNQNYAVVKDTLYKGFFLSTTNSLKLEELSQNEIVESLELIERSDLVMGQVIFYHLDDSSLSKVDLEQLTKVL